jgi:hypothetical protein
MKASATFFAKVRNSFFALIFSAGLLYVAPVNGLAALQPGPNYTVNDTLDPGFTDCATDHCSLRAAIAAANADTSVSHTINFSLIYPTTITLSSLLPEISGTLIISGPGAANLTLSGNGAVRIFKLTSGSSLNLSGVTLRSGYNGVEGGAGIFSDHGSLTITDSVLANGLAGGGDGGGVNNSGGTLTIIRTTFDHNTGFHDGAIASTGTGTLTIVDSLFNSNDARIGGAIENHGPMTVTNSTFTGNVGRFNGGAIENFGTLVVTNSTFFNNGSTSGADIDSHGGTVNVTNSTFSGAQLPSMNSIFLGGGANVIRNSVLAAGNSIANCAVGPGVGILTADAYNLATDATCASATVKTEGQLNLAPLGANGGNTPTQALLPGSAAIDSGNDVVCSAAVGTPNYGAGGLDQRGVVRPQGTHCDVGAFEYQAPLVLSGAPADGAVHLFWHSNVFIPLTATWEISYTPAGGTTPPQVTGLAYGTHSYNLSGLTNFTLYTITLNAVDSGSTLYSASIQAMPSDIFMFLPIIVRQ